jgi:hypothetical protein
MQRFTRYCFISNLAWVANRNGVRIKALQLWPLQLPGPLNAYYKFKKRNQVMGLAERNLRFL